MRKHNRFEHRFGRPTVFNCHICKRRTRMAGQDNDNICAECYELAGYDNFHNDNHVAPNADELKFYEAIVAKAAKRGSDAERMRQCFDYLFNYPADRD